MTETETKILNELRSVKMRVIEMDKEFHMLKQSWEDSQLTPDKRKMVDVTLADIRTRKVSDFVPLSQAKKQLGSYN